MAEQLSQLLKRLEAVTVRLEEAASKQKSDQNGSAVADASKSSAGDSPSIAAFEELVSGPLVTYFSLSKTIGGLVEEQSKLFNDAINAQRQLLIAASKHKKPADAKGLQVSCCDDMYVM